MTDKDKISKQQELIDEYDKVFIELRATIFYLVILIVILIFISWYLFTKT